MNVTVDETIERVEQLYATVTGKQPAPFDGRGVTIPPERDAALHVEERLRLLLAAMERFVPARATAPAPTWMPHAIVVRDRSILEIALDLPGVSGDQLKIIVENQVLAVIGRRDSLMPTTTEERRVEASEVPIGPFVRSFQLPASVAPDAVIARLAAGVLTIRINTGKRGEASQIPIES